MIRFTQGNLLESDAEALVNTVNEVGVMGKGIALMFRDAFPDNTELYERAARAGEVRVGQMFVTENPHYGGPRWIINFPTKKHWRQPSRVEWIKSGLNDLVRVLRDYHIRSVAIPPLGAGNGRLAWASVRPLIMAALETLPNIDIVVYEPIAKYQGTPKSGGVEKLTPARALIADLVRRYGELGLECTVLEVQKLAWFCTRAIAEYGLKNPLKLQFVADKFGPYADRLRHLLNALDGSYLHSEKRLADAGPYDLIWFDETRRQEVDAYLKSKEAKEYLPALERTGALIDGFESPFGMELLATVDWLLAREKTAPQVDALTSALRHWPAGEAAAQRKAQLFDARVLALALDRIAESDHMKSGNLFAS